MDRDRRLGARVLHAVDVDGSKENVLPGPSTRVLGSAPSRACPRATLPETTATAPAETSWSWKPVSCSSIQQISQAATLSSRSSSEYVRATVVLDEVAQPLGFVARP